MISHIIIDLVDLSFHKQSVDQLFDTVGSSGKLGLSSTDAAARLATNGPNKITPPKNNVLLKWANYIFGGFGSEWEMPEESDLTYETST